MKHPASDYELIVLLNPDSSPPLPVGPHPLSETASDSTVYSFIKNAGADLIPLFNVAPQMLSATLSPSAETTHPLPYYCRVLPKAGVDLNKLEQMARGLGDRADVLAAYIKPPASFAMWPPDVSRQTIHPSAITPDFTQRQGYLDGAPGGIDARFAWTHPGGSGDGVRIVDVEGDWQFSHEDLRENQGGIVGGAPSPNPGWRDHGTAVVGVIGGDRNGFGVTGICPNANVSAVSIFGQSMGSARAIQMAADRLRSGDILLIELHRKGPNGLTPPPSQQGFIPVEWWPDDFDAIRYAVSRGVIVVEAAGNGAENLDSPAYDNTPAGFPPTWRNPFRRSPGRDSGAILVGAGAPPPGTHGQNHGPDRSRLDFSNHGSAVDVQGWGREVTTTGYGDLQGGTVEDRFYTDQFSGTSSASPIVVGAIGCTQGILRSANRPLLTPATARQLLRSTGSPQQAAPSRPITERIGNRPNLRQILSSLGITPPSPDGNNLNADGDGENRDGNVTINIRRGGVTINIL